MSGRGTEALRRGELVEATIHEIGAAGSLDVTVGQIARRAGVSPALAFHYFGGKDRLFLAAMRSILTLYGAEVRGALTAATGPRARLEATIRASFGPSNFRREVVAAWLNFYVLAATDPAARRLLTVYQRRLRSNLVHGLRPLAGPEAPAIAERLAGLIDGLYLRAALDPEAMTGETAAAHVLAALDRETEGAR
ncbi:transcriptional regulator BetI [Roseicyclus sp.]|uniref:transcriptional regulator BetI n=1 Tax=Roseicyclus sp. TaxID=1914329 RepID=UPI003FA10EB7